MIFIEKQLYDKRKVIDTIFFEDISMEEFNNNRAILENASNTIGEFIKDIGWILFKFDIKKKRNIVFIHSVPYLSNSLLYNVYISKTETDIDKEISFSIEDRSEKGHVINLLCDNKSMNRSDMVDLLINETLMGYKINISNAEKKSNRIFNWEDSRYNCDELQSGLISYDKKLNQDNDNMILRLNNQIKIINESLDTSINSHIKILNRTSILSDTTLIRIVNNSRSYNSIDCGYGLGQIIEVYKINNIRYGLVSIYYLANDNTYRHKNYMIRSYINKCSDKYTFNKDHYSSDGYSRTLYGYINSIPYNLIDVGRYIFFGFSSDGGEIQLISEDPNVKDIKLDQFVAICNRETNNYNKKQIHIGETNIFTKDIVTGNDITLTLKSYLNSKREYHQYNDVLKAIKNMGDECMYVLKRSSSEGEDVKISDNVLYNHADGKIIYNDFSIGSDNERIKKQLYVESRNMMMLYFRKDITEQQIVDKVINMVMDTVNNIVMTATLPTEFNVFINNININIKSKTGKNNFTYINENRVNKTELSRIISEIVCYTSQDSADKFISSVCKIGLSVFIGITTGFVYNNRVYRFKTDEGRSKYKLIIDNVEMNISSKKLFNTLFDICILKIKEHRSIEQNQELIDNHVFAKADEPYDYIKYMMLIQKSYTIFLERSKEFLDKKINDLGCNKSKYIDKNTNKEYDGINVIGLSGKSYIIAYNLEESFAYMNPIKEEDKYTDGTYICMIDQSSMKSSIGFDTVISKMMSLKNDSVIAKNIYNLEDELNK